MKSAKIENSAILIDVIGNFEKGILHNRKGKEREISKKRLSHLFIRCNS
jgi:hypothetical protein